MLTQPVTPNPMAAIVIPAFNAADTLARCLAACLAQAYDGEIEVIVVDDGSTDGTARVAQSFPAVRTIYQPNGGPARARNTGWRAARGEIVCFTDADCVPNPHWVANLVRAYAGERVAGAGGSYTMLNAQGLLASCVHQEIRYRHRRMGQRVTFLGSFNASFRRAVLERVGGFDESYTMASGEDNALSYAIVKRGYHLIFDLDNTVAHQHPTALFRYLRRQFWHGYWRVKLYQDHPSMVRGDGYSGPLDFVQPPLYLALLAAGPFVWLPLAAWSALALLATGLLLQAPLVWYACRQTRDPRHAALAPLIVLRGLARGLGMLRGLAGAAGHKWSER